MLPLPLPAPAAVLGSGSEGEGEGGGEKDNGQESEELLTKVVEHLSDDELVAIGVALRGGPHFEAFISWAGAQFPVDETYADEWMTTSSDLGEDIKDFIRFVEETKVKTHFNFKLVSLESLEGDQVAPASAPPIQDNASAEAPQPPKASASQQADQALQTSQDQRLLTLSDAAEKTRGGGGALQDVERNENNTVIQSIGTAAATTAEPDLQDGKANDNTDMQSIGTDTSAETTKATLPQTEVTKHDLQDGKANNGNTDMQSTGTHTPAEVATATGPQTGETEHELQDGKASSGNTNVQSTGTHAPAEAAAPNARPATPEEFEAFDASKSNSVEDATKAQTTLPETPAATPGMLEASASALIQSNSAETAAGTQAVVAGAENKFAETTTSAIASLTMPATHTPESPEQPKQSQLPDVKAELPENPTGPTDPPVPVFAFEEILEIMSSQEEPDHAGQQQQPEKQPKEELPLPDRQLTRNIPVDIESDDDAAHGLVSISGKTTAPEPVPTPVRATQPPQAVPAVTSAPAESVDPAQQTIHQSDGDEKANQDSSSSSTTTDADSDHEAEAAADEDDGTSARAGGGRGGRGAGRGRRNSSTRKQKTPAAVASPKPKPAPKTRSKAVARPDKPRRSAAKTKASPKAKTSKAKASPAPKASRAKKTPTPAEVAKTLAAEVEASGAKRRKKDQFTLDTDEGIVNVHVASFFSSTDRSMILQW